MVILCEGMDRALLVVGCQWFATIVGLGFRDGIYFVWALAHLAWVEYLDTGYEIAATGVALSLIACEILPRPRM